MTEEEKQEFIMLIQAYVTVKDEADKQAAIAAACKKRIFQLSESGEAQGAAATD